MYDEIIENKWKNMGKEIKQCLWLFIYRPLNVFRSRNVLQRAVWSVITDSVGQTRQEYRQPDCTRCESGLPLIGARDVNKQNDCFISETRSHSCDKVFAREIYTNVYHRDLRFKKKKKIRTIDYRVVDIRELQ